MLLWRKLYSLWCLFSFIIPFFFLLPFFFLCIIREKWNKRIHFFNKIWSKVFFTFTFTPIKIEYQFQPVKNQPYIYCPNHFSYLDIVLMGLVMHQKYAFVGKSDLKNIPLFGYMFGKLHITVDRESKTGAYQAFLKMAQAIEQGKSLIVFPEGGIKTLAAPHMAKFKDGPFKLAIEKGIPIVPVTIPYNWIILPDKKKLLAKWHKAKAIVHTPIETRDLGIEDLNTLKQQTFDIIQAELANYFPEAFKSQVI